MAMGYSVANVSKRYGVGQHTVHTWIANGDLRAIDISRRDGGKPKWHITDEALEAFEQRRSSVQPAKRPRPRLRDKAPEVFK